MLTELDEWAVLSDSDESKDSDASKEENSDSEKKPTKKSKKKKVRKLAKQKGSDAEVRLTVSLANLNNANPGRWGHNPCGGGGQSVGTQMSPVTSQHQ